MAKNSLNSLIRIRKREYYGRKIEEHGQDISKLCAICLELLIQDTCFCVLNCYCSISLLLSL